MEKEHCVIDGQRCSKCCEVLTIRDGKNFRAWRKYFHYSPEQGPDQSEMFKISKMIKKISKRRAKKINRSLVKTVKNSQSYFTCKNYKNGQCQDYENRPGMCSGYPLYGNTQEQWIDYLRKGESIIGLYRDDCTYYNRNFYGICK